MIPQKFEPQLFSLVLSGLMSLLVSGISTFHALGLVSNFAHLWVSAWLAAWLFAYPAVLLVSPITRKSIIRSLNLRLKMPSGFRFKGDFEASVY